MAEKTRYSDAELEEFRAIIMEKLDKAKKDYDLLRSGITNADGNDVSDTVIAVFIDKLVTFFFTIKRIKCICVSIQA